MQEHSDVNRPAATFFTVLAILSFVLGEPASVDGAEVPNIVLIMADDKCDDTGAMVAEEAELPSKTATVPHLQITLNCGRFS